MISSTSRRAFQPETWARAMSSSTKSAIDHMVEHQFSKVSAQQRFALENKKRWFAPSMSEQPQGLVVSQEDPLKKCSLPFFVATAELDTLAWTGEFAISHSKTYWDHEGKPHQKVWLEWIPINGNLKPKTYTMDDWETRVYGGFSHSSGAVEEALLGFNISEIKEPFDPAKLADVEVDAFQKREALAKKTIYDRIVADIHTRIANKIMKQTASVHIQNISFKLNKNCVKVESAMLPFYILKQNGPPRLMAALDETRTLVVGPSPLSEVKVAIITAVGTGLAAVFIPGMSFLAKRAVIAAGIALGQVWVHYKPQLSERWQNSRLGTQKEENDILDESRGDKMRREATATSEQAQYAKNPEKKQKVYKADSQYFKELKLKSNEPITREKIEEAFRKEMKAHHPDARGGTNDRAARINLARKNLLNSLSQKRHYSVAVSPQKRDVEVDMLTEKLYCSKV